MSILTRILGLMPKAPSDSTYSARGGEWVDENATDEEVREIVRRIFNKD